MLVDRKLDPYSSRIGAAPKSKANIIMFTQALRHVCTCFSASDYASSRLPAPALVLLTLQHLASALMRLLSHAPDVAVAQAVRPPSSLKELPRAPQLCLLRRISKPELSRQASCTAAAPCSPRLLKHSSTRVTVGASDSHRPRLLRHTALPRFWRIPRSSPPTSALHALHASPSVADAHFASAAKRPFARPLALWRQGRPAVGKAVPCLERKAANGMMAFAGKDQATSKSLSCRLHSSSRTSHSRNTSFETFRSQFAWTLGPAPLKVDDGPSLRFEEWLPLVKAIELVAAVAGLGCGQVARK